MAILRSIAKIITESSSLNLRRTMAVPSKVAKLSNYIGTHDGTFHCDDVIACYMLKLLDRFQDHDIVRTRDPEKLAKAEIVVDVGAELDIAALRLDHHQRSFNQTIRNYFPELKITNPANPVRLSSSGLVYAVFGKDIIVKLLNLSPSKYDSLADDNRKMVDAIFEKAYTEFFEEIDAIDNGVEIASGDNVVYNYNISSGISSRVGRLNPIDRDASDEERMVCFKKAMQLVEREISEGIAFLGKYWWPRRQNFRKCVLEREKFDPSGQIVHVEGHLTGWKSALMDLEEELGIVGQLKFIICCDDSNASPWRVHAVPINPKSFICRAPLKEEWRGKRDKDLQEVSKVPDAVFIHMNGFTGGAKSLEGVKSLARQTLGFE